VTSGPGWVWPGRWCDRSSGVGSATRGAISALRYAAPAPRAPCSVVVEVGDRKVGAGVRFLRRQGSPASCRSSSGAPASSCAMAMPWREERDDQRHHADGDWSSARAWRGRAAECDGDHRRCFASQDRCAIPPSLRSWRSEAAMEASAWITPRRCGGTTTLFPRRPCRRFRFRYCDCACGCRRRDEWESAGGGASPTFDDRRGAPPGTCRSGYFGTCQITFRNGRSVTVTSPTAGDRRTPSALTTTLNCPGPPRPPVRRDRRRIRFTRIDGPADGRDDLVICARCSSSCRSFSSSSPAKRRPFSHAGRHRLIFRRSTLKERAG
jgi:hypothetical protein